MAKIEPRMGKVVEKHNAWYLRWRPVKGGKEQWVRLAPVDDGTRRTEAVQMADRVIQTSGRTSHTPSRPAPTTRIIDYIDSEFIPWSTREHRPATHYGYVCLLRQKLRAHFGTKRFCEYQTYDAAQYLSGLATHLNERSVSKLRSLMSLIFKHAKTDGIIAENPMRDLMLKTNPRPVKPTHAYTLEQMRAIIAVLAGRERVFMLLCMLGLRPSEVIALMWSDVDFANGQIHVNRSGWRTRTFESGKTGEARTVTLAPGAAAILGDYRAHSVSVKGFVVESAHGNMLDPDDISDLVKPVLAEHGIPWYSFYACRRAAATQRQNLANGNSLHVAQEMGHSIATANKHYLKPISELERLNAFAYDTLLLPASSETIRDVEYVTA